jgi:hypothetical protein
MSGERARWLQKNARQRPLRQTGVGANTPQARIVPRAHADIYLMVLMAPS